MWWIKALDRERKRRLPYPLPFSDLPSTRFVATPPPFFCIVSKLVHDAEDLLEGCETMGHVCCLASQCDIEKTVKEAWLPMINHPVTLIVAVRIVAHGLHGFQFRRRNGRGRMKKEKTFDLLVCCYGLELCILLGWRKNVCIFTWSRLSSCLSLTCLILMLWLLKDVKTSFLFTVRFIICM